MATPRFGRVQLQIMQVLWEKGHATAREMTEALSEETALAHSTVQTLLRKLEAKGAITHKVEGHRFVFYPRVRAETVTRAATRDLVDRMFSGSTSGLVAFLLKNERLSKHELEEIQRLIDENETG